MAARQFRWVLLGEFFLYGLLGVWLTSNAGWSPLEAVGLAVAVFLGLRLFLVGLTFVLMLLGRGELAPDLHLGPLAALRMVLEEYIAMILLFAVIQPFESIWMRPDRLTRPAGGRLPLLLIHGYQCNRAFWFWQRPLLEAAGWVVATHSLEPVYSDIDAYAEGISRRIDEVLASTGAPQLILIGHSMGGLASRAYLRRHGVAKVARLVTLGSPHQGTLLASLGLGPNARQMRIGSPWLRALAAPLPAGSVSIYSCHDNYVYPQQVCSTLNGAANVAIGGVSHLGMAFSPVVRASLLQTLESEI